MDRRLKLIKLANRWFIHIPNDSKLEDLELIHSNTLWDLLDTFNKGCIDITIATKPRRNRFITKEFELELEEFITSNQASYIVRGIGIKIKLSNKIKQLFNEFPKIIYIRSC